MQLYCIVSKAAILYCIVLNTIVLYQMQVYCIKYSCTVLQQKHRVRLYCILSNTGVLFYIKNRCFALHQIVVLYCIECSFVKDDRNFII